MKTLLFRLSLAITYLYTFFVQIEIGQFDSIMSTIFTVSFMLFFADLFSASADYGSPWYNTNKGCITWYLFGKEKINLNK